MYVHRGTSMVTMVRLRLPWYNYGSTMVQPWFIYHGCAMFVCHGSATTVKSWFLISKPWYNYHGTAIDIYHGTTLYRGK